MRIKTLAAALACALLATPDTLAEEPEPPTEPVVVDLADGERAVRVVRRVQADADDAWRAWTTGEGLTSFLGAPAWVDLRVGGRYEIHFVPDAPEGQRGSEGCEVLTYLPNRVLSFSWNAPPSFGPLRFERTTVVLTFDEVAPGLINVTLTHHGWGEGEDWDRLVEYFARAWTAVMDAFAAKFPVDRSPGAEWSSAFTYLFVEFSRPDLLETMTEEETRILADHYAYLKRLTERGTVILAGPCTDMKGPGIVVFYASDEAEARRIMEADPAVAHGVFKANLHPIALSLLRERDARPSG